MYALPVLPHVSRSVTATGLPHSSSLTHASFLSLPLLQVLPNTVTPSAAYATMSAFTANAMAGLGMPFTDKYNVSSELHPRRLSWHDRDACLLGST